MLVALTALFALASDPIPYRITLADGAQTTARLVLPETADGPVRVESEDTSAFWQPGVVSGATARVTGKLTRWEAFPIKGGWKLERPIGGALPLDAPLLTFHDMRLFLGKRYDDLKAQPKRFLQLGYASERPGLDRVVLSPAGTEVLVLDNKAVRVRRLRYTATLWLNGKTQRGTIAVGPSGELLRADPPFVSTPLRAASLLTKTSDGALVLNYRLPAYTLRAEPTENGFAVKTVVAGHTLPGTVLVDSDGRPVRIENDWPGKPFVGLVAEGSLSWTLQAPAVTRTVFPGEGDLALFAPQLFATAAWEKDFPQAGERRSAVLLLMHEGLPDEVELERLPDPREGVHRYRLTGTVLKAELLTDGTRLLLLRFADGARIVGPGGDPLLALSPLAWP